MIYLLCQIANGSPTPPPSGESILTELAVDILDELNAPLLTE
jgi:hypothetical protein